MGSSPVCLTRTEELVASGGLDEQHRVGQLTVWWCQTANLWGRWAAGKMTWWRPDSRTQDHSEDLVLIWTHQAWKDVMPTSWPV